MKPLMFVLVSLICVSCAGTRERLQGQKQERAVAGTTLTATPSIGIQIFK